jgi:divalent metal cation (Fe/Co/Zn/Cd) transporter
LLTTLPSLNIDLSWLTAIGQIIPQGEDVMEEIADARAMWFAGASVLIKEYLYRITLKVAKEEHSNVLLANALHHRSDAFSSLVVLGAIVRAYFLSLII